MKTVLKSNMKFLYLLPIVLLTITGCAVQSAGNVIDPPGFFHGLMHGFILIFSFVISLFTEYAVYAFPNSGGWYDFGFLLGVLMFFGGGGAGAKCKS